jgi:hypothetical protein
MQYSFGSFRLDESTCERWKGRGSRFAAGTAAVTSNALSQCIEDILTSGRRPERSDIPRDAEIG